jgi:carbonic anhydrase
MRRVDIVYTCVGEPSAVPDRPRDAAEACLRLNAGNQAFAELFDNAGPEDEVRSRQIFVDAGDFGRFVRTGASPKQAPFAAVLGCSDARVPIELIFNEGPNDLFVVRVAGNTLGDDVLGSLKYAADNLGRSLKVIVVVGHSGCGAVSAAVDMFLDPSGYLSLTSRDPIRMLVDRLQIVIHAVALRVDQAFGTTIRAHSRYRDLLIETAIAINAALAAHTLQQAIDPDKSDLRTVYGVYVLSDRSVWAPRVGSDEVKGLASPPSTASEFVDVCNAALRSKRVADLLSGQT